MSGLLDTVGMFDLAAALPEQVAAAATLGAEVDGLPAHDAIEQVVVLGMGGSGVAGDVLAAVAGPFMPVPVTVVKGYEAPASIGEGTLCFAISYSGDTEETVEAAQQAAIAGAHMVVLSTGGAARGRSPGRGTRPTSCCPTAHAARRGRLAERASAHGPRAGRACSRAPRSTSPTRSTSSPGGATSSSSTGDPPSSSPARSAAPCPWPTAVTRSARSRPTGSSARSTRTPRPPRSGPRCRRWPTTRSAAGASTATSPAR